MFSVLCVWVGLTSQGQLLRWQSYQNQKRKVVNIAMYTSIARTKPV